MSSDGHLLGARISADGQWRFPETDSVPNRFKQTILHFEDEHFYSHFGLNPVSTAKAFWNNLTTDKRRGGSTISQQVIRLANKNPKRTYWEKLIESFQATRLESKYSKEEILNFYTSHAPFGSNVVGLSAASWRYFGISSDQLTWGQAASLAVLPNAPSLIYPGKNDELLKQKRDALLEKLYQKNIIDETTAELAKEEDLPGKPLTLPDTSPHFTERIRKEQPGVNFVSTIDFQLQQKVNSIVKNHYQSLKQNHIHNMAVLILDNKTRQVLAYIGNTPTDSEHKNYVDIIPKGRSTGSILKPFLYAAMLDTGELMPEILLSDTPANIDGYAPQNFDRKYRGAVPAGEALIHSLNIPAVRMLQEYGLERFNKKLRQLGQKRINKPAGHYGLSVILGGAESSLWDITNAYAGMADLVDSYTSESSAYFPNEFDKPVYAKNDVLEPGEPQLKPSVFGAGAAYTTLNTLRNVNRPIEQANWEIFNNSQPIAWKTGSSFGFKDAWAVGSTSRYSIGVWVGNATGEGRPGLLGIQAAAPVLFDVLAVLPRSDWFKTPYDDLTKVEVCSQSGHPAGVYCEETETQWIPNKGIRTRTCPYHHQVFLDQSEQFQVNSSCYPLSEMKAKNWFSLPPVQEYYYKSHHPEYRSLPSYKSSCLKDGEKLMEFIFPEKNQVIILPKNFEEELNEVVFKLAHSGKNTIVYWYLNGDFAGQTSEFHEISLRPKPGIHILTAIDSQGNEIRQQVEIRKS